jgi:hypothetical protein
MSTWLLAAYSLRLKKIYADVKDKIPGLLQGTFQKNRKAILDFVLPLIRQAYREGVAHAKAYTHQRFNLDSQIGNTIDSKIKENLFKEFWVLIQNAEDMYELKWVQREKLQRVEKRKLPKEGSDLDKIQWEYENAIKLAVNNLILNAGEQGQFQVFQSIRKS